MYLTRASDARPLTFIIQTKFRKAETYATFIYFETKLFTQARLQPFHFVSLLFLSLVTRGKNLMRLKLLLHHFDPNVILKLTWTDCLA